MTSREGTRGPLLLLNGHIQDFVPSTLELRPNYVFTYPPPSEFSWDAFGPSWNSQTAIYCSWRCKQQEGTNRIVCGAPCKDCFVFLNQHVECCLCCISLHHGIMSALKRFFLDCSFTFCYPLDCSGINGRTPSIFLLQLADNMVSLNRCSQIMVYKLQIHITRYKIKISANRCPSRRPAPSLSFLLRPVRLVLFRGFKCRSNACQAVRLGPGFGCSALASSSSRCTR